MKTLTLLMLLLALTPMTALANQTDSYKMKGDSWAMSICRAVLSNDSIGLDEKLKSYHKQNRVKAKYLKKNHPAILEDFSCNGSSLLEFAEQAESSDVARYLISYRYGKPILYVEDVAAN